MNRFLFALILLASAAVWCGCDEREKLPPPRPSSTDPAIEDSRPTTQAILGAQRGRTQIGSYPLSLEIPSSLWKVEITNLTTPQGPATLTMVTGPAPHEDVTIVVSPQAPLKMDMLDRFIEKHGQADPPDVVKKADHRKQGNSHILEVQIFRPEARRPDGAVSRRSGYQWRVTVFVAAEGDHFSRYELSIAGLTPEQFEQDREFLQSIVDSLRVETSH